MANRTLLSENILRQFPRMFVCRSAGRMFGLSPFVRLNGAHFPGDTRMWVKVVALVLAGCSFVSAVFLCESIAHANTRFPTWRAISSGGSNHTCALTWSGAVYCWGRNSNGQLGNAAVPVGANSNVPVQVEGLAEAVKAIAVGSDTSCAVLNSGKIQCWGSNLYGQIGNLAVGSGSIVSPTFVVGLSGAATSVSIGVEHACAALSTGEVNCWGDNDGFPLGTMAVSQGVNGPVTLVPGVAGATSVSAGDMASCSVVAINTVYRMSPPFVGTFTLQTHDVECWGSNGDYQAGQPNGPLPWISPTVDSFTPNDITATVQADLFSCALSTSKGTLCWGTDVLDELGDGGTCANSTYAASCWTAQAVKFPGNAQTAQLLDAGEGTGCTGFSDGSLWCWGYNAYGKLGIGNTSTYYFDVGKRVPTSGVVTSVGVGFNHICAVTDGGNNIECWGRNNQGQLGDATYIDSAMPTNIQ